ncbi:MAG: hypothetical protein U5K79_23190 [Cyclobacteriaceae bacterium]|nr:hypothetical protein [Cyclobacteriaceae bacterium]
MNGSEKHSSGRFLSAEEIGIRSQAVCMGFRRFAAPGFAMLFWPLSRSERFQSAKGEATGAPSSEMASICAVPSGDTGDHVGGRSGDDDGRAVPEATDEVLNRLVAGIKAAYCP